MTDALQSQLDQVLAPCPFCGTSGPRHCTTKDEYGRPSYGVQCVGGECAIVGPQAGSQVAAAEKWNRQHGPAIRAAVGGEAVAWMLRRKRDDFVRGCYATKPTDESLEFAELDGDYYTPLYASPTATVDVGALREFHARLNDRRDHYIADIHRDEGRFRAGIEEIEWLRDQLAALIVEKA